MTKTWVFQMLSSLCDQKATTSHCGSSAFEDPVISIHDVVECALALNERQALGGSGNARVRIRGLGEAAIEAQPQLQLAVVRAESKLGAGEHAKSGNGFGDGFAHRGMLRGPSFSSHRKSHGAPFLTVGRRQNACATEAPTPQSGLPLAKSLST